MGDLSIELQAEALVRALVSWDAKKPDGTLSPELTYLLRMGAARLAARYCQTVFGYPANERWICDMAAMSEGAKAVRKQICRMTLDEVLAVIDLRSKKAAETEAAARKLQLIVDQNPDWYESPSRTLADVTGFHE